MQRQSLVFAILASASLGLAPFAGAQQTAPPSAYQGVSQPPSDTISTSPDQNDNPPIAKPSAAVVAPPAQPAYQAPATNYPAYNASAPAAQPLMTRPVSEDPDGDMVHPRVAQPGELLSGATIQVKLQDRLSSTLSEKGQPFHGQVAFDVMQDGKVLIPAGSGIEGHVSAVSSGHFGGHGSLRLTPEAVILPDGSRFQLHAETTGTRGSKTKIGSEGSIYPGSRAKKDGIEYGAVMGTGAVTGALLGGPVGALTGTIVGAGVVTTHLMVDHPQTNLEPGTLILFSLTEPMNLMPLTN
jgi:hypothetical protein